MKRKRGTRTFTKSLRAKSLPSHCWFMLIHWETSESGLKLCFSNAVHHYITKKKQYNLVNILHTLWSRHVFTHCLLPCNSLFLGSKVTECSELLKQAWCATRGWTRGFICILWRNSRQNNYNQPNFFNISWSKVASSMQTAIFFTS